MYPPTMNEQVAFQRVLVAKYENRRAKNPRYSHAAFSKKLGLSRKLTTELISGEKKVSAELAKKIASRLGLDPLERAELFKHFVKKSEAAEAKAVTPVESSYFQLSSDQFRTIAEWQHFAIRSLMRTRGFRSDDKWIARRLGLSPSVVRTAIERLKRLGMIQEDAQGNLTRSQTSYRTSDDVANVSVRRAHAEYLKSAETALHTLPVDQRDFSSMMLSMSPDQLTRAKEIIRKFQDELSDEVESSPGSEVYQLCVQLFPRSGSAQKKENESAEVKSLKGAKKIRGAVILSLLLGAILSSASPRAFAGDRTGNGGGAWVCREQSGAIRWAKLVDLFESQSEFGLTLPKLQGFYTDIVSQMQTRLNQANPSLASELSFDFTQIDDLKNNPPSIHLVQDTLEVINDSLYRLKPNVSECAGGMLVTDPNGGEKMIPYEQVVNYKNDGSILVQSDLFSQLSETDKAALVFHETIYKYRREVRGDTDSVVTREIVGLIFSTLSTDDLKASLARLGEAEVGPFGMKFVPIQPGSFVMGSSTDQTDRSEDELQHLVTLTHEFEMQATSVTQEQWVEVMGHNPSSFQDWQFCPSNFKMVNGVSTCPTNPVENVSYDDIQVFLSRLNSSAQRDSYTYRLPTEAEWEFSARAGSEAAYPFGDDVSLLSQYEWFVDNSGGYSHPVATLKANQYGLYDMEGNVRQWVSDWYGPYRSDSTADPKGPDSPTFEKEWRVIRGGSWRDGADASRSASRYADYPSHAYANVGFRLVRIPTANSSK
jgi:uncharacterized protein (TIGR02147 family)